MGTSKKIVTIIGARPQIIKSAAISRVVRDSFLDQLEEVVIHTGQHYDENMSDLFFKEMNIPEPKYNLGIGSDSHGIQTAKMLIALESLLQIEKPNAVIIYGDTNSTIAGALSATKLNIPVIHIEAGLRSFNKQMPEEINRISSDHMSTMLFTPTEQGAINLKNEGFLFDEQKPISIDNPVIYHCGDIMYDNSLYFSEISDQKSTILEDLRLEKERFILCTIHRDINTDNAEKLNEIFEALYEIQKFSLLTIVIPLHPRTKSKLKNSLSDEMFREFFSNQRIKLIDPVGYLDVIALEKNAKLVITDSGGLQKEAYFFKKPCIILRAQTEWVEIVKNGNAILADTDKVRIVKAYNDLIQKRDFSYPPIFGDGKAAYFICNQIMNIL